MFSLFMTTNSGGTTSGMNAMCTGMRFCDRTAIRVKPPSSDHFTTPTALAFASGSLRVTAPMILVANNCGSPDSATAMAKAPSSA